MENLFVKNPLQDLLSSLNAVISTNKRNWILTGHVNFKLRYDQIYQLKTTQTKVEFGQFEMTFWRNRTKKEITALIQYKIDLKTSPKVLKNP